MSRSWRKRKVTYVKRRKEAQQTAISRAAAGSFCTSGKVLYDTRKIARAALRRRFPGEVERGVQGMREYRCPECGKWHLGHLPRWKRAQEAV